MLQRKNSFPKHTKKYNKKLEIGSKICEFLQKRTVEGFFVKLKMEFIVMFNNGKSKWPCNAV